MIKIGDFSKLSRISIRMLRYYDEKDILKPIRIDDFNGYRYYNESQLTIANQITALKDMGFSLSIIEQILKDYPEPDALRQYLIIKHKEIEEQVLENNRRLLLLDNTIKRLDKGENVMKYTVTLNELPERYVMSVRNIIPAYQDEGTLWHTMMSQIAQQNVKIANPCYGMAIFHDKEYKENDVDIEIQMAVDCKYQNTKDVVFKKAESIKYASVTYKGSYDQIGAVNEAIANWISDNNYQYNGAMFNIYHVSPAMEPNPENWVTEVCYPIK